MPGDAEKTVDGMVHNGMVEQLHLVKPKQRGQDLQHPDYVTGTYQGPSQSAQDISPEVHLIKVPIRGPEHVFKAVSAERPKQKPIKGRDGPGPSLTKAPLILRDPSSPRALGNFGKRVRPEGEEEVFAAKRRRGAQKSSDATNSKRPVPSAGAASPADSNEASVVEHPWAWDHGVFVIFGRCS